MEAIRKPFQGVTNIVRFNWHFYIGPAVLLPAVAALYFLPGNPYAFFLNAAGILVLVPTAVSLLVSLYVYDLSGLYSFEWINPMHSATGGKAVNIHAGFDETSACLQARFSFSEFFVFDFYDGARHTEVSIKRARKAVSPYPGTRAVRTSSLPLPDNFADVVFVVFSAHEIRCSKERTIFFRELQRVVQPAGKIIVTEHLRDLPNFLAYNIGFFHFLPGAAWYRTFKNAGLDILGERNITPFIKTFTLIKNGMAS